LPKRGFKSKFPKDTQIVNLAKLEKATEAKFNAVVLFDLGFIRDVSKPVKILGTGKISRAITLEVNAISESAKAAVEKAGGKIEIVVVK